MAHPRFTYPCADLFCDGNCCSAQCCTACLVARLCRLSQAHDAIENKTYGRTTMEMPLQHQSTDYLVMHSASDELVKLIRKLRRMGMEEQAEGLQMELERRR